MSAAAAQPPLEAYPYEWRWKSQLREYFGCPCRIRAGDMRNAEVQFPDGRIAITARAGLRRRKEAGR